MLWLTGWRRKPKRKCCKCLCTYLSLGSQVFKGARACLIYLLFEISNLLDLLGLGRIWPYTSPKKFKKRMRGEKYKRTCQDSTRVLITKPIKCVQDPPWMNGWYTIITPWSLIINTWVVPRSGIWWKRSWSQDEIKRTHFGIKRPIRYLQAAI